LENCIYPMAVSIPDDSKDLYLKLFSETRHSQTLLQKHPAFYEVVISNPWKTLYPEMRTSQIKNHLTVEETFPQNAFILPIGASAKGIDKNWRRLSLW
jgi:hypothetical protein